MSYHYSSLMCFCPSIQGCSIYNLEYSCKNWFYIRRGPPDPTLQGNGQEEVLWSKDQNTCSPGGKKKICFIPVYGQFVHCTPFHKCFGSLTAIFFIKLYVTYLISNFEQIHIIVHFRSSNRTRFPTDEWTTSSA